MKITIRLLSDLSTTAGETYNSLVDTDVVYDKYGIPYIPAKRIKGCIREAALEMCEMGIMEKSQYTRIFGEAGYQSCEFWLSNAYIRDYKKTVEDLEAFESELTAPQNVLAQYAYTRTQTAVDQRTGVADENSLRTIRVVRKGLVFEADCGMENREDEEILKSAVSLVKHIGMARTRGLGLVTMRLEDGDEQECKHVMFPSKQFYDRNKISYTIHLNSTLICKTENGNQAETEDYIAGSKVLGLIAGAMGQTAYREMMSKENMVVSNAYIKCGQTRCIPGRASWQKEKDQSYDADGKMMIFDLLYEPDCGSRQMTSSGIDYIADDKKVMTVDTEISYHHQRPEDKSIGRATGNEDGSSFYQLAGISEGQSFGGFIYAGREVAEKIIEAVGTLNHVRMGYGKSGEFGDVDFTLDSLEEVCDKNPQDTVKDAVITVLSDLVLYNKQGILTAEPEVLKQYLEDILSVSDLEIRNPFFKFDTVGGFNVTWKRRKPVFYAIGKGSSFILHSECGFDIQLLKNCFIGERTTEGYGEIIAEKFLRGKSASEGKIYISKYSDEADHRKLDGKTGIIYTLLQDDFEKKAEKNIREKAGEFTSDIKNESGINLSVLNAAVAKIRVLFRTEKSYEAMSEQIRQIEDEKKKNICIKILEKADPKSIAAETEREIQKNYGIEFHSDMDDNEKYRFMYRSYIIDLKYCVKILQKEQDA